MGGWKFWKKADDAVEDVAEVGGSAAARSSRRSGSRFGTFAGVLGGTAALVGAGTRWYGYYKAAELVEKYGSYLIWVVVVGFMVFLAFWGMAKWQEIRGSSGNRSESRPEGLRDSLLGGGGRRRIKNLSQNVYFIVFLFLGFIICHLYQKYIELTDKKQNLQKLKDKEKDSEEYENTNLLKIS